MPKFLWRASYSEDGLKGLVRDGGTKRRALCIPRTTPGRRS